MARCQIVLVAKLMSP